MTAARDVVQQARQRGIQLHVDDTGNLKIGGPYSDSFLDWAKRHKSELIAELQRPSALDALLDEARAGTGFTLKECTSGLLFAPLDLQLIASGEMSVAAAKHFLEYQAGRVCRKCLGGGCRQCNFSGLAPPKLEEAKS